MFYLTTHSTHVLRLYGVGYIVKDNTDSERGNPLLPLHGLLFLISSKGRFICINPTDRIAMPRFSIQQVVSTGYNEK